MSTVNIHEAKSTLSRLIAAVESGAEHEIIIARNGKPAARLTGLDTQSKKIRLGVAAGQFKVPDDIDALNPEIEKLFYGEAD